jgi:hypothetical protein
MARSITLGDVIKTHVSEDQCTNFLVWLLEKLPNEIMFEICKISRLSVYKTTKDEFTTDRQYILDNSRPDALIHFNNRYLLIETKIVPDAFDKKQFINHFNGGCEKFGQENLWLLFLSADKEAPDELQEILNRYPGKIGFISWYSIIQLLKDNKDSLGEKYVIIIVEFLNFTKRYKFGRLKSMNDQELIKFIEDYPAIAQKQEAALQRFLLMLSKIKEKIIKKHGELVQTSSEDNRNIFPCLYNSFTIQGWHTKLSAYVFIDIQFKQMGILLTGYQDKKNEKQLLLKKWTDYEHKFQKDPKLCAFTYVGKEEDEYSSSGGYFKNVEISKLKSFNPDKNPEFNGNFYWGYIYPLTIKNNAYYFETIVKDFSRLFNTFIRK